MIGFRVPSAMITSSFLDVYFEQFDFIEIKVKDEYEFINIIQQLNSKCLGKFSIHLPKRILYDVEEFKSAIKILELINKYKLYPINIITHFYFYEIDIVERLKEFIKQVPNQISLCIENISEYNVNYIEAFENTIRKFKKYNINICMDLGHLMYGGERLGYTQKELIDIVKNKKSILKRIKEVHIHDFNNQTDHICLSEGKLNKQLIYEILQDIPMVPVIIETNVVNPEKDGCMQVKWIKEILNYENTKN